jgi:hypothetical protein
MEDKTIVCYQCGESFIFKVSEQIRCLQNGFDEPKRCPACRQHKQKEKEAAESRKFRGKKKSLPKYAADDLEGDW